jgi:hypothetical protein
MAFSFFITAEHAMGKAINAILNFGAKALPVLIADAPVAETIATVILPADGAVIAAVGNAGTTMLAKALVAVQGANALKEAAASGTLTIQASVDEVNALKALVPATTGVIASLGLSHALLPPAVPAPA